MLDSGMIRRLKFHMKKIISCISLCGLQITSSSFAATPDATVPYQDVQEQMRQQERLNQLRQQQEIKPDVRETGIPLQPSLPVANDAIPDSETPCFVINKIQLVGDDASYFQFALDEVLGFEPAVGLNSPRFMINDKLTAKDAILGRCLGVIGVNAVMARVQNAIIHRGFITTRVLAAPQEIKSGNLALTIVSGRINDIRFTPDSHRRARSWNAVPVTRGDRLNLRDIEQSLENFKRVPTVEADIKIEPASVAHPIVGNGDPSLERSANGIAKPGWSDLVISYKQRAIPFRISASLDDSGSSSTGKHQGNITLSGDNLLTLSDLFYVSTNSDVGGEATGSHGTSGFTWHYSLPYGYWLLSTTTSNNDYHQTVAGATQSYIYSGKSQNSELTISRLIFRNAINKTSVSVRAFYRTSNNLIDDTEVDVQRRRVSGWELGFNQTWYRGNSVLDYHFNYRRGTGAWDSLPAPEEFFGNGTSRMHMLTGDVNLTVPFSIDAFWGQQAFQYNAAIRGQVNYTPLTPQDRFSIGNRYTVRGFDGAQTLMGDNGWYVQNNLTAPLSNTGRSLYVGLDYGAVGGQASEFLIGKKLAGMVIGLRGDINGGFGRIGYEFFVGQPIYKPKDYITSPATTGFNFNWSY